MKSIRQIQSLLVGLSLCSASAAHAQWTTATYEVTFDSEWSAATHPVSFPGSAHYSGVVGATHNTNVHLWEPGSLASPGIKSMAETGSKTALISEANAAITAGTALSVISDTGVPTSPFTVTFQIDVRDDFPLVTIVSMIAPSPDWFVGTQSLNLRPGGAWTNTTFDLFPWDAGTDSGSTYNTSNQPTIPAQPISSLQGTSPFLGTPRLGTMTFTLIDLDCYADCDGSGTLNILDYICFGDQFAAGSGTYADCDSSGTLNILDYICFGDAYAVGCQ